MASRSQAERSLNFKCCRKKLNVSAEEYQLDLYFKEVSLLLSRDLRSEVQIGEDPSGQLQVHTGTKGLTLDEIRGWGKWLVHQVIFPIKVYCLIQKHFCKSSWSGWGKT